MIKVSAITFDLWDTLIQEYPGGSARVARLRVERIRQLLASRGIAHTAQEIQKAYDHTGEFLGASWSRMRDVSLRDQVLFMLACVDSRLLGRLRKGDLEQLEKVYEEGILEAPPRLLPESVETLRAIRAKGFKVGLISNTGRTPGSVLRIVMDDLGILEFFDSTTFSNEITLRKPSEAVFRAALSSLSVSPRFAVHVGDDPRNDIEGAKGVGMRAIHVAPDGLAPSSIADARLRSLGELMSHIDLL